VGRAVPLRSRRLFGVAAGARGGAALQQRSTGIRDASACEAVPSPLCTAPAGVERDRSRATAVAVGKAAAIEQAAAKAAIKVTSD
jgi:hypothetical protein